MYLEKFGIKIFQKKNFLPFLTFLYRFVMPTTPIVGVGPKNVFKLIFYDIPSWLWKKISTQPLPYRHTRRVLTVLDTRQRSPGGTVKHESSTTCGRSPTPPGTQKSMAMSLLGLPLQDATKKCRLNPLNMATRAVQNCKNPIYCTSRDKVHASDPPHGGGTQKCF